MVTQILLSVSVTLNLSHLNTFSFSVSYTPLSVRYYLAWLNTMCRLFLIWTKNKSWKSYCVVLILTILNIHTWIKHHCWLRILIFMFSYLYILSYYLSNTLTYHLWREKILDKALVVFWSHPWTKKQTFTKYMVVDGYKLTVLV